LKHNQLQEAILTERCRHIGATSPFWDLLVTYSSDPATVNALRVLIDEFIEVRLNAKLDKLTLPNDEQQRQTLIGEHLRSTWLADAARRATQIQLATHTLKPIHPDARGSTIYRDQSTVGDPVLIGSHVVTEPADDVVGNAAALDVYKLLKLTHDAESLLSRARRRDSDFHAAMAADASPKAAEAATEWIANFAALAEATADPATHTLAKQLYFPLAEGGYHLLAPLFPTALVHDWHERQASDRFSDAAKAARDFKRGEKRPEDGKGYRDYPGLAVQKFGGTKPQNISQLNSERGGAAHLLSALPPVWRTPDLRLPWKTTSVFTASSPLFRQVAEPIRALRQFLIAVNKGKNKERSILSWREERGTRVDDLIARIQAWAAILQQQPGWTLHPDCQLNALERQWLDPYAPQEVDAIDAAIFTAAVAEMELSEADQLAAYLDERDAQEDEAEAKAVDIDRKVAQAFAGWLNGLLTSKDVAMDDVTHREWVNRWLAIPVEASHEN